MFGEENPLIVSDIIFWELTQFVGMSDSLLSPNFLSEAQVLDAA